MRTTLPLPRGYDATPALRYLGRDPESSSERANATRFAKAMLLDGRPSVVEVELGKREAGIAVRGARSRSALDEAITAVERLLGLPNDPRPFEQRILADARLAELVRPRLGLRMPLSATVFESLVWAIVGQQVNLAFAYKLRRVVIELAGRDVDGMRAHPDAQGVAALDYSDLTARQFSRRKAEYLIDTARLIASGALEAEALPRRPADEVERLLLDIRGLGPWSANYVMMRGCGFPDCVPFGDTGLTSSLQDFFGLAERPDRATTEALMAQFAPYRSFATFHFWMRLR